MNLKIEKSYQELLIRNKEWVEEQNLEYPEFFKELSNSQEPRFLWIGCSDSRVPANTITGTQPGDMFVHRNIANMVVHTDINMLSVLQYAVEILKVEHVIVCGHYGCGGVKTALQNTSHGLIDNWLRNIKDVYRLHSEELAGVHDDELCDRLVELNVKEQVLNLCKTSIIQDSWKIGERPHVHGWVYSLEDGLIRDLDVTVRKTDDLEQIYKLHLEVD